MLLVHPVEVIDLYIHRIYNCSIYIYSFYTTFRLKTVLKQTNYNKVDNCQKVPELLGILLFIYWLMDRGRFITQRDFISMH